MKHEPNQKSDRESQVREHAKQTARGLEALTDDIINMLHAAETECLRRLNEYVRTERLLTLDETATYLGVTRRWLDEGTRPGREPVMPFPILSGKKKFIQASVDAQRARMEVRPTEVRL